MRRLLTCGALVTLAVCARAQDFAPVREIEVEGHRLLIDNTSTRLAIELVEEFEDRPNQAALARGLFPSYVAAAAEAERIGCNVLPSVALLYAKGKSIDDGAYAAVELALEGGLGPFQMGKPALLRGLFELYLPDASEGGAVRAAHERVVRYIASALAVADQLERDQGQLGVELDADVGRKPIGFYTWNDELAGIFRRDTALQERFDLRDLEEVAASVLLAAGLTGDGGLPAEYDRLNALYSALTNPIRGLTAQDVMGALPQGTDPRAVVADEAMLAQVQERLQAMDEPGFALFQPSRSKEMFLLWLAAARGLSSVDELIAAIRAGAIDLAPDDESGWYEYQQYALEPLLRPDDMPEGEKLELGEKYRELLEAHFKAMLTNIRETHVKQLEVAAGEVRPPVELAVTVKPHLECEPIATTYLRFGDAYRFLTGVLREHLGEEALAGLHALREGAEPREATLGDELVAMRRLMEGAYLLTCRDIGLEPELEGDLSEAMADAEKWLGAWRDDPDMERDVRMMVPVAKSPDVYWCIVGVRMAKLAVRFETPPQVTAVREGVEVEPEFRAADYWVPVEQFIEVTLPGGTKPLNREEFRALCDRAKTEGAIESELRRRLSDRAIVLPPPQELTRVYPVWFGIAGLVVIIAAAWVVIHLARTRRS